MKSISFFKGVLFLAISIWFVSCSIEKRQHLGGYRIEWKNDWKKNKGETKSANSDLPEENPEVFCERKIIPVSHENNFEAIQEKPEIIIAVGEDKIFNENTKVLVPGSDIISETYSAGTKVNLKSPKGKMDTRMFDPLAVFSLVFDILGLLLILVTNLPMFIAFALPFLGFIFGLISLCRIAMKPKEYKGLAFALIGTTLSLIVLAIVLIVVII